MSGMGACHTILNIDIDTEMIKDSLTVELWEKQGTHLKIRVLDASTAQLRGIAFATDGRSSVSYTPHTNTAIVGPADIVHMPQVIENPVLARRQWLQSADLAKTQLLARVREQGLVVYKVEIPLGQEGRAQYTIDARQWWIRQVEYNDQHLGAGVVRLDTQQCFADLDDALFTLDIPDGATLDEVEIKENRPLTIQEAQTRVGFRLREPRYLPPDTQFFAAYQLDKNMALIYTGAYAFTLVQGPKIGAVPQQDVTLIPLRGRQATLVQQPDYGGIVVTWSEDDLQFSIAGSLNLNEILQIAESLE